MNKIDQLLKETRQAVRAVDRPTYLLAQDAGLSHVALNRINERDWNPSAKTLRKLWRHLERVKNA